MGSEFCNNRILGLAHVWFEFSDTEINRDEVEKFVRMYSLGFSYIPESHIGRVVDEIMEDLVGYVEAS